MQTQDALQTGNVSDVIRSQHIYDPFKATVRGTAFNDERFTVETILDSFSTRELSMRLSKRVEEGARLFIVVQLSDADGEDFKPMRVALRGVVERVERKPSNIYQVDVSFRRYRMFW